MRSVFVSAPLLIAALILSACSSGSQVTPVQTQSQATQQSAQSSAQSAAASDEDVLHDSHHIFYPLVGQQNKAAHVSGTANNLLYNGGAVLNAPQVYVVFWGFSGGSNDPQGEVPYLEGFLSNIGGTSWLNIVTQYCSGIATGSTTCPSGSAVIQNGTVAHYTFDDSTVPSHPSDSQIQIEATNAANNLFGLKSYTNVAVFVATPTGHSTRGFGVRWCAYHGSFNSSYGTLSYTNFPYQTDAGSSCGANFDGLPPGELDGVSIVGGHEYAESITDPYPSTGWLDKNGSEIGDKCAWSSSSTYLTLNGSPYAVQPLWSNASASCATSY